MLAAGIEAAPGPTPCFLRQTLHRQYIPNTQIAAMSVWYLECHQEKLKPDSTTKVLLYSTFIPLGWDTLGRKPSKTGIFRRVLS